MKKRRAFGQLDARLAVTFDGAEDNTKTDGFFRVTPDGECEAPSGAQHPMRFDQGLFRMAEMENAEIHCCGVEQTVSQRQLLGVALAKINFRMKSPRLLDHRAGKIDAQHRGAAFGRRRRDIARSAGDIEKLDALLHSRGGQEGSDGLIRQIAESLMVLVRYTFPTGVFEGTKFFGIENHDRVQLHSFSDLSTRAQFKSNNDRPIRA
jgi:hypothetical protein